MPDIDQLYAPAVPAPAAWRATVRRAPNTATDTLLVTIDATGRDEEVRRRWTPRATGGTPPVALPAKGDRGLVCFDDDGDAWLILWYPA